VRVRLCVAFLAKGGAIACETRLDSHSHSGSECYRTFHLAHYEIRQQLTRQGRPIGPNDLLIAAHARALNLTVVTANMREFSRVPDLRVDNWFDVEQVR